MTSVCVITIINGVDRRSRTAYKQYIHYVYLRMYNVIHVHVHVHTCTSNVHVHVQCN